MSYLSRIKRAQLHIKLHAERMESEPEQTELDVEQITLDSGRIKRELCRGRRTEQQCDGCAVVSRSRMERT